MLKKAVQLRLLFVPLAVFLLAGCGPTKEEMQAMRGLEDYMLGDYPRAVEALKPVADKPDENYVLNNGRLGMAALAAGDLDMAEAALYRAYEVINATGVNDGGRGAAAAIFAEKYKVWKGEPFERAMINFYLGVVYYARGDFNNARAAFENSLFKLRDYGESKGDKDDEYRDVESNFAIGYIMLGRCMLRLGEPEQAEKNFKRAVALQPRLSPLADARRHAESNVLLVVDYGYGPRRVREFDNSLVAFRPTPQEAGGVDQPRVRVNGQLVTAVSLLGQYPPVDTLAMAQDKRWQSIDTIRVIKSIAGTGLMAAGAYEATKRRPNYGAAAGLIVAGALIKASATGDVRTLETLPRTVYLLPLKLPPGKHDIRVDFPRISGLSAEVRGVQVAERGEVTVYLKPLRYRMVEGDEPPGRERRGRDEWMGRVR